MNTQEKVAKCKVKLARLEQQLESEQNWEPPKFGDYYISGNGTVGTIAKFAVVNYVKTGNSYATEEDVLKDIPLMKAQSLLRAYSRQYDADFVADWEDGAQPKCSPYYAYYDGYNNRWGTNITYRSRDPQLQYFSLEICEQLIADLNSGRVKLT